MMGLGVWLLERLSPAMETIAPLIPGEYFDMFFTVEMFQRVLLAGFVIALVVAFLVRFC